VTDLLVRGGTVVTPAGPVRGPVYAVDGRVVEVPSERQAADVVVEAGEGLVLPGFVQAHVHLCQTLFRGLADDMDVVEWLRRRVWPLERAHDAASLRASAALGITELLLSGTTTVLSMETADHTGASFEAAEELGIRAFIGPALMDRVEPGTEIDGRPTSAVLDSLHDVMATWHGRGGGRLAVAVSPRGVRNATDELWRECARLAQREGLVLHTHVAENEAQAARLALEPGGRDVYALDTWGALGSNLVMAHGVWLEEGERRLVRERGATVCHCPSANLKLASGIAPIPEYLDMGINVALGADGAACNNTLSAFVEMRLAGLIHKPRRGPRAMPAGTVFDLATMGGARALGIADQVGTIEPGKRADLVVLRRDRAHVAPLAGADPVAAVVYAHGGDDVDTVVVDGQVLVQGGRLLSGDEGAIRREAEEQRVALLARAGL
jgi:cytosine/adenosine deaminase-related metal-dependent hydrolase